MRKASRSRCEDWAQVVYALALSGRALAEQVAVRYEVSRDCQTLNGISQSVCSWAVVAPLAFEPASMVQPAISLLNRSFTLDAGSEV